MGTGVSLILIAVGLVLLLATTAHTIGVILLVVGIIGIVLSMAFWSTWGGVGAGRGRRTTVIEE